MGVVKKAVDSYSTIVNAQFLKQSSVIKNIFGHIWLKWMEWQ